MTSSLMAMSRLVCVRFTVSIPSFAGYDGVSYGPYRSGSVADIPALNSKALLRRGACYLHNRDLFYDSGYKKSSNDIGLSDLTSNWISHSKNKAKFDDNSGLCILHLGLSTKSQADSCITLSNADITSNEFVWNLPGQKTAYNTCGTVKFGVKCSSDGCNHRQIIRHQCDRPECPICHPFYAARKGHDIAERLDGCNQAYLSSGIKLGYFKHFTFSPPLDYALDCCKSHDGYKQLRKSAINVIKNSGVRGGSMVFHYWRLRDNLVQDLNNAGYGLGFADPANNGSLWDGALSDALGLGSVAFYVVPGPHWHVVGVGHTDNSDVVYHKTGWVYKKIRTIKCKPVDTVKALSKVAIYALAHASRLEILGTYVSHPVTYFGVFAYNKVKISNSELYIEKVRCPKCDNDLLICGFVDNPALEGTSHSIDWDLVHDVYSQAVRRRWYELTKSGLKESIL